MDTFGSRAAKRRYERRLKQAKKVGRFRFQRNGVLFMAIPLILLIYLVAALELNEHLEKDYRYPPQVSRELYLTAVSLEKTDAEIFDVLAQQAREQQVNLYRISVADPKIIYTFVGNPDTLLADPYGKNTRSGFDPFYVRRFVPYQEMIGSRVIPPGSYLTDAGEEKLKSISEALKQQNIGSWLGEVNSKPAPFLDENRSQTNLSVLAIIAVALIGGSAYATCRRWKVIALRRIIGWRALRAILWDYVIVIRAALLTVFLCNVLLVLLLWVYNGAQNLKIILTPTLLAAVLGLAVMLAVQTLMLLLMLAYSLGKLLKGHIPQKLLGGVFITLQLFSFGVVVYNGDAILNKAADNDALVRFSKQYEDVYTVSQEGKYFWTSTGLTSEEEQLRSKVVEASKIFLKESYNRGILLLSAPKSVSPVDDKRDRHAIGYKLVNDSYLKQFPIMLTNETRLRGDDLGPDKVRVGIPQGFLEGEALAAGIARKFSIPLSSVEIVELRKGQENTAHESLRVRRLRQGQKVEDLPVVISKKLEEIETALFGLGTIAMFKGYEDLKQLLKDSGFTPFVSSVRAVDAGAHEHIGPKVHYVYLLVSASSFVMSSLLLTWLYLQRSRKRVYLQVLFGRGFWHRHWRYFTNVASVGTIIMILLVAGSLIVGPAAAAQALPRAPLGLALLLFTVTAGLLYVWTQERRLDFDVIKDG